MLSGLSFLSACHQESWKFHARTLKHSSFTAQDHYFFKVKDWHVLVQVSFCSTFSTGCQLHRADTILLTVYSSALTIQASKRCSRNTCWIHGSSSRPTVVHCFQLHPMLLYPHLEFVSLIPFPQAGIRQKPACVINVQDLPTSGHIKKHNHSLVSMELLVLGTPAPPPETKIYRHSNPLYKMA